MKDIPFLITSILSLIGAYASYLLPLIIPSNLTPRETLLVTFFSSIIFLTIFISSVFVKINKFKYKIKSLQNNNDTINLKIELLKEQNEHLKNSFTRSEQQNQ